MRIMKTRTMKRTILSGIIMLFSFLHSFAQVTFDNKPYVDGEMLVQLEPNGNIQDIVKRYPQHFDLQVVEELSTPMRVWLVKFDHQVISHTEMQQLLYDDNDVTIADYNYYIEMRETVPDDLQLGQQWHHINTGQTGGTADADIDSDLAWDITTGGTSATNDDIVVCIIEGANLDHDDLRANRWINPTEIAGNGVDDDGNGYIDDIMGWNAGGNNGTIGYGTNSGATSHGTNCVGMFAAVGDNNLGVVGANWNLKVMVSTYASTTQSAVIAAYTYPLIQRQRWNNSNGTEGAFVVATSASWGIDNADPSNYPLWCNFYDTLGRYGIINIGATTNSNLNVDVSGDMPTACSSPYMVGVGRTDHNDNTAGGYGITTIDFGAPGINVRTTANSNGYTTTTGTSFACPLTAGVVGLAYSIPCVDFMNIVKSDPQLGADLVLQALLEGVDQKAQLATRFITGGRLNARNTIDILMTNTCDVAFCPTPSAIVTSSITENSATISWEENVSALSNTIYIRPVGATTYVESPLTGTTITFSDLEVCTEYEYYLTATCSEGNSSASAVVTFTTQGCGACVDNAYCSAASTDLNQIQLSVTKPTSIANNFTFQAPSAWGANLQNTYASGELVVVNDGTVGDSLGCTALTNAAQVNGKIAVVYRGSCEFGIKALNAQNAGAIGVIVINNAAGTMDMGVGANGAGVTIPVAMISNTDGAILKTQLDAGNTVRAILGTKKDWIQSVVVDVFNSVSGDDQGYSANVTEGPIDLEIGGSYPITFNPGFQTQPYEIYFRSWIDFDQNGSFDADELVYDQLNDGLVTVSSTISIPLDAVEGSSRMRIMMSYMGPGQATAPSSCAQFSFGEVEDYCVEILPSSGLSLDSKTSNLIKLFPNPSNEYVTIQNGTGNDLELKILDLTGRTVVVRTIQTGNNSIETSKWNSGTYFYVLSGANNEALKTGKIEVIH
jgi:hypothetical protein